MSGDVSVLKETAKSREPERWTLTVGSKVEVKETVVTGLDGRATFQVADGSTIQVFPNSRFVFRSNAPNWQDLLDLMLGKVRVHIEHLNGKPNPHKVHTPTAVISVRGTTFDITVDGNETSLIEVEEGLVDVRHLLQANGVTRELRGGEALRVYRDEPIARNGNKFGNFGRVVLDALIISRPGGVGGGGIPGSGGGGIPGGGGTGGGGGVGDTDPGTAPPSGAGAPGLPGPPPMGPGAPGPPGSP